MNNKNDLIGWHRCIYKAKSVLMSKKHEALENIKVCIKKIFKKLGVEETSIFYDYLKYATYSIIIGVCLKLDWIDKFVLVVDSFTSILSKAGESSINHSVMFSTSAAILATIFTMIFGFLLAIMQITDPFTYSKVIKSKETKYLMRLYLGTIVLSLLMLETTFKFPVLVLVLSFFSILSIYPFLHNMSSKLTYEVGATKLKEELYSLIDSNKDLLTIDHRIGSLGEITKEIIKDTRWLDFLGIMHIFDTINSKAAKQKMVEVIETIGIYYSVFLDLLIEKNSTTDATKSMLMLLFAEIDSYINDYSKIISCESLNLQAESLKGAGIKMIQVGFDDRDVNRVVGTLRNIFFSMQKKRDMENEIECLEYKLEPDIVEYIGVLAIELFNHKSGLSSLITVEDVFFAMGTKTCQVDEKIGRSGSLTSVTIVQQLKSIEAKISSYGDFEERFKKFKDSKKYSLYFTGSEFEEYSDKFKSYYYEQKQLL